MRLCTNKEVIVPFYPPLGGGIVVQNICNFHLKVLYLSYDLLWKNDSDATLLCMLEIILTHITPKTQIYECCVIELAKC